MNNHPILVVLLFAALTNPVAAQEHRFVMVAIAAGQTAQVNVANTGTNSTREACHINIVFADHDGNLISDPDSSNFVLRPGTVVSTAIDHPNLRPGERFHVRGQVRMLERKATGRNECDGVRATFEVFDTDTGRTTIFWELPTD